MFDEYDVVSVIKNYTSKGLSVGEEGTICIVHDNPKLPRAYEIDFSNWDKKELKVITLTDDEVQEYCTLSWKYNRKLNRSEKVNKR